MAPIVIDVQMVSGINLGAIVTNSGAAEFPVVINSGESGIVGTTRGRGSVEPEVRVAVSKVDKGCSGGLVADPGALSVDEGID